MIEPVRTFNNETIADGAKRRLTPEAEVYSDGLGAFHRFAIDHAYTCSKGEGGRAATERQGARWANVLPSNLKRSIAVAYHAFKQHQYVRRYLGEAAYRFFNRRFRPPRFVPRLLRAMVLCARCAEPFPRQTKNFYS